MPGTNQYLAFGTGAGSNTLSYASYSATLATLINPGYVAGTADAQHVNTVLRQATVGVAGLAKFATDWGTLNCMDDGSPANYALAVKNAIDAIIAATATPLASFTGANQSLAASGYQKLPGGMIMQWGVYTATATISFPIAFPSACFAVFTGQTNGGGDGSTANVTAQNYTTTQFDLQANANELPGKWFAIGY